MGGGEDWGKRWEVEIEDEITQVTREPSKKEKEKKGASAGVPSLSS